MRTRFGAWCAAAAVILPAAALGGVVRQHVHGRLVPTDETSRARGVFHLLSQERDDGTVREAIEVACQRLDAARDDEGNRPEYRLFLTTSDDATTADFGAFVLTRSGRAGYRWSSRRDAYPDGVETITAFGGGTIEVRRGDDVVLTASVPEFLAPDDDNGEGSGARGVRRDASRLRPAETDSRAHGWIEARYANTPRGENEQVRLRVQGLSRDGAPYAVVCVDAALAETELGEITPRGRFGEARLVLDTRDGAEIPGGGVLALSGQDVEVRDAEGTVVLTGTFPAMSD